MNISYVPLVRALKFIGMYIEEINFRFNLNDIHELVRILKIKKYDTKRRRI